MHCDVIRLSRQQLRQCSKTHAECLLRSPRLQKSITFLEDNMERNICNKLRELDKLSDVIIRVDGVDFRAHKLIMCGCSQYFRALFAGNWYSPEKKVYCIPEVSPDMMELIMQYIYTGHPEITVSNVACLLAAADYLDIQGLLRLCSDFLKFQLSPFNCIGIWRYAAVYSCHKLRDCAYAFILQHFEKIILSPTQEFLEMSLSELSRILEQDRLNMKEEEMVFKAVMTWIEHDLELRSPHIITLLPKVRLGLTSTDFCLHGVKENQLICQYEDCSSIIDHSLKILNETSGRSSTVSDSASRPRVPHSVLLAIAGWDGLSPYNIIEAYDSRAKSWRVIICPEEPPRDEYSTAFLDGFIYFVGGFDDKEVSNRVSNSVSKFDLITQTWHEVAPMHAQRYNLSIAVLDKYIYAMGGSDDMGLLNTVERYLPLTNQWSFVAPMHKQREEASATTLHGKIYICGGASEHECHSTVECFDPQSGHWTYIAPMLERRCGMGVITLNNQIFVVGGFDGNEYLKSVEVYDPQSNTWKNRSPMLHPRCDFGIEVMDERLYVVGGYVRLIEDTSKTMYYDEKTDKWFGLQDISFNRGGLSCCVVSALPNITDYTADQGSNML